MTNLSPAARAVLDALKNAWWLVELDDESFETTMATLATAALRAVAYQVAEDWNEETCDKILRIANELENN